jgi:hypothetical protein
MVTVVPSTFTAPNTVVLAVGIVAVSVMSAVPSNATPLMLRAVASLVAVAALPVKMYVLMSASVVL